VAKSYKESNERLEFLGDSVLGMITAAYLFKKFPFKDEGFLTEIRSRMVSRESLNVLGRKLGLDEVIEYENQKKTILSRSSMYGDALEAFIGAIYLDKGFAFTQNFIISKILTQYVKNGGGIILTGTHEFSILQQLGLFDLDFGYFCAEPMIHSVVLDHPVLAGFSGEKALKNYAYPLDVSDPGFVTIADVRGYPVMGYKCLAAGKVAYLGLEYYYDEIESSHFLANTIRWIAQPKRSVGVSTSTSSGDNNWVSKSPKRSEELLRAGTGLIDPIFDVKIYPNPYVTKATIDLDLAKASAVAIDVTDETGRIVGILLPLKNLNAGLYRLEMPNLSPGVYFVQFKSGEKTVVKKVVKTVGN
jgi:hypothetical protein